MAHPNPRGFIEINRETPVSRHPSERVRDYNDIYLPFPAERTRTQAQRCMGCGVPFCHQGCPLGNLIPDFNEAVAQGDWKRAYALLVETNNFPEFTGRICPAPCEGSCVLGINHPPVAIELIEKTIIEQAFKEGWVKPPVPYSRTGKRMAVIGSGPAGLAAAEQLNRAGHTVTVFERAERPGGLLTFGIPDFKLEKWVVNRRLDLMREAGITFTCGVEVGKDVTGTDLLKEYEAVILCIGATKPRDVKVPGREIPGIHFAMDYLYRQNKKVYGDWQLAIEDIHAKDKDVVVIGGGDTGSDCIGTAHRQGAKSVTSITWGDRLPEQRTEHNPWPEPLQTLHVTSSHEEGGEREFAVVTRSFIAGPDGQLSGIEVENVTWHYDAKGRRLGHTPQPDTRRIIPCQLALIALGFSQPEGDDLFAQLGVRTDDKGNVVATDYQTDHPQVFAAGDMRIGQSLVVNAIFEGREAAAAADRWLQDA